MDPNPTDWPALEIERQNLQHFENIKKGRLAMMLTASLFLISIGAAFSWLPDLFDSPVWLARLMPGLFLVALTWNSLSRPVWSFGLGSIFLGIWLVMHLLWSRWLMAAFLSIALIMVVRGWLSARTMPLPPKPVPEDVLDADL